MNVYKINDIINCDFLKIPKSLFANQKYKSLSSDAKLSYAFYIDIEKEQYSKTLVNLIC